MLELEFLCQTNSAGMSERTKEKKEKAGNCLKGIQIQKTMQIKKIENYSVPLSTYFNIFHSLFLSPFKVIVSPKFTDGKGLSISWAPELISTKFSKVSCSLALLLMIAFLALRVSSSIFNATNHPNHYGKLESLANEISEQLQFITFSYCMWFKQSQIQRFLQYAAKYPVKKIYQKVVILLIFISITSWAVNFYWSLDLYLKLWKTRKTYVDSMLGGIFSNFSDEMGKGIAIFCMIANELNEFFSIVGDVLLLILGITLNNISKQFESCTNDHEYNPDMVLKEHEHIKSLVASASEAFGLIVMSNYVCIIPLYASTLTTMMGSWGTEPYEVLTLIPYVVGSVMTWGLLAQFHCRINRCMKCWLYNNRKGMSLNFRPEEVVIIAGEIQNQTIGLESTFFTITYGFLGSMLGLIITYSIIMLQLKSTN